MSSEYLLHHAAAAGDTKTVREIVAAGADPNKRDQHGRTALYYAVSMGHSRSVAVLLDVGAKPAASEMEAALWENLEKELKEMKMPTLSVIGEPGAGKSHFATLLYIHLRTHEDVNVQVEFGNASWNIINSAGRLGRGIPLEPTPRDLVVSNTLTVSYKEAYVPPPKRNWLGGIFGGKETPDSHRSLTIPVLDSAGEILQLAMDEILSHRGRFSVRQLREEIEKRGYDSNLIQELYTNVFRANGFCFVVDAKHEWEEPENSVEYKHAAFLQNLSDFRRSQEDLEPIRNSMLVLTKYDAIKDDIERILMNQGNNVTRERVGNFLCPNLVNQLYGPDGDNPVKIVLSDTEWEIEPMSPAEITEKLGAVSPREENMYREGRFRSEVSKDGSPVPAYNKAEYEEAVEWIKGLI